MLPLPLFFTTFFSFLIAVLGGRKLDGYLDEETGEISAARRGMHLREEGPHGGRRERKMKRLVARGVSVSSRGTDANLLRITWGLHPPSHPALQHSSFPPLRTFIAFSFCETNHLSSFLRGKAKSFRPWYRLPWTTTTTLRFLFYASPTLPSEPRGDALYVRKRCASSQEWIRAIFLINIWYFFNKHDDAAVFIVNMNKVN